MATAAPASAPAHLELVGRRRECELIDDVLVAAASGRSRALVVRGEPGIGKSAMLEYAAARSGAAQVIGCRGIESESEIPFAGLLELLRPILHELEDLPKSQRAALAGVLALAAPAAGDRFEAYVAAVSLIAAAGQARPLLALVDDAHWLDGASAEAIGFVARRLHDEPVALLIAVRDGEPSSFATEGLHELTLAGLDEAAAEELLRRRAPRLTRAVAAAVVRGAAGNPLALRELALDVVDGTGLEPLRPGPAVERAFVRRVRRLAATTQSALLVASAAASDSARTVIGALAGLGLEPQALEAGEAEDLVALRDDRVVFEHPLVRSAVYHAASPAERRRVHRALAEACADEEPDRAAWHLAAATASADESVAQALEGAALRARDRAAHSTAAHAFERAARLTPRREVRARRLYDAAVEASAAGRSDDALGLLGEALHATREPILRADVQHLRGRLLISTGRPGAGDLLVREGLRVAELDPSRAAVMIVGSIGAFIWAVDQRRVREAVEHALRMPTPPGSLAELYVDDGLAWLRIFDGDVAEARRLAVAAAARLEMDKSLRAEPRIGGFVGQLLYVVEEYDHARRLLDMIVTEARAAVALPSLAYALASLGIVETRAGRWLPASAALAEAVELTSVAGSTSDHAWALEMLARLEAGQGRDADCRAHAEAALAIAGSRLLPSHAFVARSALGLLALGRGRFDEAVDHLRSGLALVRRRDRGDATFQPYLTPDLVEAQLRAGARDDAERTIAQFEREVGRTRVPSARAAALRCRGLLADEGEIDDLFERALAAHGEPPCPNPFERARTCLCYGERLRRARRRGEAKRRLEDAFEAFAQLGAEPWVEQAQAELELTGRRHRSNPTRGLEAMLTAQELRVALIVGRGATNREAAAALFLSPKTIENHLTRIFEKLGLHTRTELVRRVALEEQRLAAEGDALPAAEQG